MKKFFKKLSFGLALAMAVSSLAPAAGAFAAANPTLNASTKYLHLGKDGADQFDFNIKNKQKGWSYEWYVEKDSVISVNEKNGLVTAEGVGSSKVFCDITDKDGELIHELRATVTVRDNIETVKITNVPTDNKLKVGQENDFNRSFVTASGSTKKTSSITRWTVKEEGAKISESGVFVAEKAGTYTVVATSFQSKAKYEAWKADNAKYAAYVLATDEVSITVGANIVETKQVDSTSVKVIFDTDMSKVITADKVSLSRIVGTSAVAQRVEKVTFSTDGKEVTIKSYIPFVGGTTYSIAYAELKDTFTAAKSEVAAVADIKIVKGTVVPATVTNLATTDYVKLYNADGVDITTTELLGRVTFKMTSQLGNLNGTNLILFSNGDTATIEATFHTYTYDSNYAEKVFTAGGVIVATNVDTSLLTDTLEFTLGTDFNKKTTTIAVGDAAQKISFRYKTANNKDNFTVSDPATVGNGLDFYFEATNSDVAIIQKDGTVYPTKDGVVVAILYKKSGSSYTAIGTVELTVVATRKAASVTWAYGQTGAISTSTNAGNRLDGQIVVKDQTGTAMTQAALLALGSKVKAEVIGKPDANAVAPTVSLTVESSDGKISIATVAAPGTTVGNYIVKVTVDTIPVTYTVNVLDGSSAGNTTAKTWAISFNYGSTTVDLKGDGARKLPLSVLGYNAKGAVVNDIASDYWQDPARNGDVKIVVTGPNGVDYSSAFSNTLYGTNGCLDIATVTGAAVQTANGVTITPVTNLPTGTYKISVDVNTANDYLFGETVSKVVTDAANNRGRICNDVYFTITDSTTKIATVDNSVVAATDVTNVYGLVKKAFSFTLNGTKLDDAKEALITEIVWSDGKTGTVANALGTNTVTAGDIINVQKVKIAYAYDGEYQVYEFTVGANIQVK